MATKSNANYTLTGRITNSQGEPPAGLTVRAYDQDPKSPDDFLGEATTDQDGRYAIRFSEAQFKPGGKESGGPDVYIVVLDGDEEVGRSKVRRNAGRRISISLQVDLPEAAEPDEPAFSVNGLVSRPDGLPLAGVVVRAYDQGLRTQRTLLGEARTEAEGSYTIGYEQNQLLDPNRGSPNLLIEVILKEDVDPVKSEIRYNARRLETIDLTVDPDADKSMWERLQGRLQPAIKDVPLAELKDDDLDFIAKSYRLPLDTLRPARAAALAARKTSLPDWFHFALAQQGLPVEGDALLELPEARILAALQAAQQAKTIPAPGEKEQHSTLESLRRLQADHALKKPLAGHRLPAQTLFELAGLPQDAQRQLARALIGREPGLEGSISLPDDSGLNEEQLKAARLTLAMARLSDDHIGVVRALRVDRRVQSLRDLARHYDPQDWEKLVGDVAAKDNSDLPDDLKTDGGNGRAAYARRLYLRAVAAYPTVAVAYGLSRRKRLAEMRPNVALLLQIVEADADFDIGSTRLTSYVNERREALKLTDEDAKAAIDTLKGVQRLYRLRAEMPFIARLLEEPVKINDKVRTLDSAAAIVHVGKGKFVDHYGSDAALGREMAVAVYNAAEKVAARTLGLYTHFNPAINTTPLPAAIGNCPVAMRGVPDWPTLFGTLDGCACEPCESVYSPAAYLTDLLAFVERHVQRNSEADSNRIPANGLEALARRSFCDKDDKLVAELEPRRPDIAGVLLSCRNAETELPYVDLALEIMENAVAPRPDDGTLRTTLPEEQLTAQAEHFNPAAYETLSEAIFPLSLPFDLWNEEESLYLNKLGTSRAELLETLFPFQKTDVPDQDPHDLTEIRRWQDKEIAQARLGLADNVWRLISELPIPAATAVLAAEQWGFSRGADWWHPLRNADSFLARSGLTHEDMLRLFTLRSFNPTGSIGIANDSLIECDPKKIQLKGLNVAALEFLHRFLRLHRALGWSLRQLDQALLALSPPSRSNDRPALDETFLVCLSHVVYLQERFGQPLDELLSWWSPLDTNDYQVKQLPQEKVTPSLYARLFLSGRPGEAGYDTFQLNATGNELSNPNQSLNNQLPVIAGAVRLPLADLEELVSLLFTEVLFRGIWPAFDDIVAALPSTDDSAVPTELETWLNEKQVTLTPNARIQKQQERLWKVTDGDIEYEFRKTETLLHVSKRTSPPLNLANISLVFRHASIARALRLKIEDYLTLNALIGFDPFTTVQLSSSEALEATLQTIRFVERASVLADSGFSIAELDYLLRQTMTFAGKTVAPTEAWIQQSLSKLKVAVEALGESLPDAQALRELQSNALATSLAEVLELSVPVCKVLLEHTKLPANAEKTAVSAFLAVFGEQEEQDTAEVAASPDHQVGGVAADAEENGNGAEDGQPDASQEDDQKPLLALMYRLHKASLVIRHSEIQAYELIDAEPNASQADSVEPAIEGVGDASGANPTSATAASADSGAEASEPKALPRYLSMQEKAGWLDILGLPVKDTEAAAPFDAWMRTVRLFNFRDALLPEQQEHCFELFDIAAASVPGSAPFASEERRRYFGELAKFSGWAEDDLRALVGQFDIDQTSSEAVNGGMLKAVFPRHFADERLPSRILTTIQLLKRLGASAFAVEGWYVTPPVPVHPGVRAARIKDALKARYGDGWAEALRPLRDPLRERQRQALVSYLLHKWNLERAEELFDHFLIDVEMSPCMMTSRLIQATAAVQLFVQRVVMNLEPGLFLSAEGAEQWDWMKNYRVWEANRKIFLYPENWIEPELRDDKTPFFKDLENELLQADITNETAETALMHYLEKLHEVARLQICGQYLDWTGDNRVTLHVFARTRDIPHRYYYRRGLLEVDRETLAVRLSDSMVSHVNASSPSLEGAFDANWTAWERVDVDIEGDHLIPVVFNRRVYLFWPIFTAEDEAPLTHLAQQILQVFSDLIKLQTSVGKLIQGLLQGVGASVIGGLTNGIIQLLDGIRLIGVGGTITDLQDNVRKIRRDLLRIVGIEEGWTSSRNSRKKNYDDSSKIRTTLINQGVIPDFANIHSLFDKITDFVRSFGTHFIRLLPAKRLEVQLAWSEFKGDSWTAKKTSSGVVTFRDVVSTFFESLPELQGLGNQGVKRLFTFRGTVEKTSNRLSIECFVALPFSLFQAPANNQTQGSAWLSEPKLIGRFRLNGCNGTLEAEDKAESLGLLDLLSQGISEVLGTVQDAEGMLAEDMRKGLENDQQLSQRGVPITPDDDPNRPSLLRNIMQTGYPDMGLGPIPAHYYPPYPPPSGKEDRYRILARHQDQFEGTKLLGFFYQDLQRIFFCLLWPHSGQVDLEIHPEKPPVTASFGYLFFPFYHPYTCALLEQLQRAGVHGIYQDRYVKNGSSIQLSLQMLLNDETFFEQEYYPENVVQHNNRALRPIEEFNFSIIGAYSQYNWEIFFHIPLLIANRLTTNQKFAEAQHWFHCIFDPTDASRDSVPDKYWRTKPFVERSQTEYDVQDIDQLLLMLNDEAAIPGLQEIEWAVRRWREDAFNPHLVARTRSVAFQKTVVMKYIDNLIAWADALFRRESREAVNEAMQLYILAAKLLGPRPRRTPRSAGRAEMSFNELKSGLDAFSNALVELENHLAGGTSALPGSVGVEGLAMALEDKGKLSGATLAPVDNAVHDLVMSPSLKDITRRPGESSLYFCVPPNDKLLEKWDIVADRLFKIRHCQNIEGQTLTLSLLSPPIDPALLVRARAMGMDMDTVLRQIQSPLPHYRFQTLAQKATELCGEVKSLGGALLSALEKRDGEQLALLRNTHELRVLEAVTAVKEQQIKEVRCSLEGLKHSQEATTIRRDYHERLRAEFLSPEEEVALRLNAGSLVLQIAQFGETLNASATSRLPNVKAGFVTTLGTTSGGENIKGASENAAQAMGVLSSILGSISGLISTMGSYRRRAEDWQLQITLANKELEGLEKQICAAEIRVAVAEADLENHKLQIRNNRETQDFMQQKFTNQALYDWMTAQTASLYFQSYQLAYDLARKAQQAFAFELGEEDPGIIRYGYWDSLKKGLLAGEHLQHDLKRLEIAYLDRNRRDYELTKHISLSSLAPLELIRLRETGKAEFGLPEALFDMDFPGHYMRRIKSVSLSIPCITGPYSGVSATLKLMKSRVRHLSALPNGIGSYPLENEDDPRFRTYHTATRAIATSSAQNDSGLFELNLRDERFLPFEGEGVESLWELTINKEFAQFDLDTISDVVLHIRYTARDGGEQLRNAAVRSLADLQTAMTTIEGKPLPLTRLFSVRHEFPTEWARFRGQTPASGRRFALSVELRPEHYPFWSQGRDKTVAGVDLLVASNLASIPDIVNIADSAYDTDRIDSLNKDVELGNLLVGRLENIALPAPEGEFTLFFDDNSFADLWIGLTWV